MVTWSITMRSGSLSGRSALAFLDSRFAAFLRFNLGTGVPSSGVTGVMEMMSLPPPPLAEVEGRGATYDAVSAGPFLAGAAPAALLSTSSRPRSLGSRWRASSACSSHSWAGMRSMVSCSQAPIWPAFRAAVAKSLQIRGNRRLRMASWYALYWMPSYVRYRSPCGLMKNLLLEALT